MILQDFLKIKCQRCKRLVPYDDMEGSLCPSCTADFKRIKFKQSTNKDYKKIYGLRKSNSSGTKSNGI